MIRRIQALNYRCLRYVDVALDRFQMAVGANATGKSTLFDALAFVGDLVTDRVEDAVRKRTRNFQDLVWQRPPGDLRLELAVELDIPDGLTSEMKWDDRYGRFRYEVAVVEHENTVQIRDERALLISTVEHQPQREEGAFVVCPANIPSSLASGRRRGARVVLSRAPGEIDVSVRDFDSGGAAGFVFAYQANSSILHALHRIPGMSRVDPYVRDALHDGIHPVHPEPNRLRTASSPDLRGTTVARDGSNLPWLVKDLRADHPDTYRAWMEHVRATLPDLRAVSVNEREDERTAYLVLEYASGIRIPSWVASEGTLRFLLLTLIAYLPRAGLYLIEEPENGLHPFALDAVHDSLSYPGKSQVVAATHSPDFVQLSESEEILCFAKDADGATVIVRGSDHPIFREAETKPDLRLLFTTGTFG